jgi:hypothetical protein
MKSFWYGFFHVLTPLFLNVFDATFFKTFLTPLFSKVAKWQSGKVAKWQSGKVAKWQSGKVTKWQRREKMNYTSFPIIIKMEHITRFEKRHGVDIFYGDTFNLHPENWEGRVGKNGIDKSYTLEKND